MMELKTYQLRTLDAFSRWLEVHLKQHRMSQKLRLRHGPRRRAKFPTWSAIIP